MHKLIAALFDLQGWIVYRCEMDVERVDIYVGRPRKEARCKDCGQVTRRVHGRAKDWRQILHSWCDERPVYLRVRPRRFWCGSCGRAFTEKLPAIERWSRRTERADQGLLEELAERSFRSAARHRGVGVGVLRRALVRRVSGYVDIGTAVADLPAMVLGIDEHSFRGQRMVITITCVWPKRRLLAILPDDRVRTLERFLRILPSEIKHRIVGVCLDMKPGWRKALGRQLPKAQIVVDRFHVMQDANRRVDEARLVEQQVMGVKLSRWPLVKNEDDLTDRQAWQLAEIRKKHKNVAHFHWMKEQLRDVYQASSRAEAEGILSRIILNAEAGSDAALVQWSRTLRAWREPILAFHDLRVSNGYTEGVHTKIKLLKRISYGFRNVEVYVRKMLLAFVPLAWLPSTPHLLT
ncbi:MAG: ISL3 family transposase [Thermaerobacterales bacterium]